MVELRLSRDLVADPRGYPALGRPENIGRWLGRNSGPDRVGRLPSLPLC